MLLIDWIAVMIGSAVLFLTAVRILRLAVTGRDWELVEPPRSAPPSRQRSILSSSRVNGIIFALLCLYAAVRTPIAAMSSEEGWPLAMACAAAFGMLLLLAIRWTMWAWRTEA